VPRILFFIFIGFLVWFVVRWIGSSRKRDDRPDVRDDEVRDAPPTPRGIDAMQQCAWCGAHVPSTEAVTLPDGRIYCGEPHRAAALEAALKTEKTS
jgi:hypothetical protein